MLAQAYDSHSSIRRARREKSRAYRAATVSVRIGKQEAECRAALAIECPRERRQELDRLYDRKTFGEERARMHAAEASVLSGMGGFVSEHLGRAGKIFVASTRRAGKLESGPTKEWTGVRFAKKAMSLDDEYVEINKMMVRVLRLDLDVDYNLDHLENALRLEVGIGIPCLPHLVAGRIRGNVIERPHLIWLLTDAVCFSETARKGPQKLLSGVYKGMVSNLAPYGADGGAPMLGRVKNPLSRKMGVVLMNDSDFPSLADYAKVAWEGGSREEWLKSVLAARPGTDVERSNRAFDMTRAACFEVLRTRRNAGCARLRACVDHHDVEAILFEDVAETVSNRRCRRSVIRWVAETWIQSGQRERGRFADSLSGDGKERMSMGAVLSAAARRGETLSRVTDSYVRLGTQAPADAVASMAGVSRRTVYAYRDEAVRRASRIRSEKARSVLTGAVSAKCAVRVYVIKGNSDSHGPSSILPLSGKETTMFRKPSVPGKPVSDRSPPPVTRPAVRTAPAPAVSDTPHWTLTGRKIPPEDVNPVPVPARLMAARTGLRK